MLKKILIAIVILTAVGFALAVASRPVSSATASVDPTLKPAPAKITTAQRQALGSARDYLSMTGFSKAGLLHQLTSSAGDGYSRSDATYAVNHVDADWNAEAVRVARDYLATMHFSRAGLINQLHSSAGSGFTTKQATYAADKVGL